MKGISAAKNKVGRKRQTLSGKLVIPRVGLGGEAARKGERAECAFTCSFSPSRIAGFVAH